MSIVIKEKFAERLSLAMLKRGVTTSQISERVGAKQPTISGWQNGEHGIGRGKLRELSEFLGVDPIWLSGQSDFPNPFSNIPDQNKSDFNWDDRTRGKIEGMAELAGLSVSDFLKICALGFGGKVVETMQTQKRTKREDANLNLKTPAESMEPALAAALRALPGYAPSPPTGGPSAGASGPSQNDHKK